VKQGEWFNTGTAAVSIDADFAGNAWITNDLDELYH
jgi:hypothetical protein